MARLVWPLAIVGAAAALSLTPNLGPPGKIPIPTPSTLAINLHASDLIIAPGKSMTVAMNGDPACGSVQVSLVDRTLRATTVASATTTFEKAQHGVMSVELHIPASGLPPEHDYAIVCEPTGDPDGSRAAAPCSARAMHSRRLDLLMEVESELLFSSAHYDVGDGGDDVQRVLALVRASLEQKLRDDDPLDSATASFERLLGRLRAAAGFGDSTAWYDPDSMPWADELRRCTPKIQRELQASLQGAGDQDADGDEDWESADYEAIAPSWRVRHLWRGGAWLPEAEQLFPETIALLKSLEAEHGLCLNPMQNVACGIARQPAGSGIAPHCDGNVLGLTCHLGLQVPTHGCWIEVGGERREWKDAELLVMDTTFVHRTSNEAREDRYVLMLNVLRPGVSEADTRALKRHLSAPPLRLDTFNPAFVWLPASAPRQEQRDLPPTSVATATKGDVFAAVSPVTELAPSQFAVEVAPSTWLPLRHCDETRDGLATVVPLVGQAFIALEAMTFRELPCFGATEVDASVDDAQTIRPNLGVLDEDGYIAWIGLWEGDAASVMKSMDAPSEGDELDVPFGTLRQHLELLRKPLQAHSRWLPFEAPDGSPLLQEVSVPGGVDAEQPK